MPLLLQHKDPAVLGYGTGVRNARETGPSKYEVEVARLRDAAGLSERHKKDGTALHGSALPGGPDARAEAGALDWA